MITNYQEAQFLYSSCETERCEQENAFQVAQAGLQLAKQKFQYARKRLTKAEFRLGRTRYMIKKGGFSEILRQKSYGMIRRRPVIMVNRTCIIMYPLLSDPPHNQNSSDNNLITIPEAPFTLRLD
jgi:hypothetical protein